jgi:carotenoid 1,2-hydratase
VALYGAGGHHWAMTERGRGALERSREHYALGPSALAWDKGALTITLNERTTPLLKRIKGVIRLEAPRTLDQAFALDAGGLHWWRPIAPDARVVVDIPSHGQNWCGHGYCDSNDGARPIARDFLNWDWARGQTAAGPVIHYDVTRRDGTALNLTLGLSPEGRLEPVAQPAPQALAGTLWRVPRLARCDAGASPRVIMTCEDTPFYTRSVVATRLQGEAVTLMHESLSLDRLAARWVETLLPFRMPRLAGRRGQ